MSFGQEIKDFLNGWGAVTKISGMYDDAAYKRKRGQALDTQMNLSNEKLKQLQDPERQGLEKDYLRSRANYLNGGGQRTRGGAIEPENYEGAVSPVIPPDTSVPSYADGGVVGQEDDDEEEDNDLSSGASALGGGPDQYALAAGAPYGGLSAQAGHDAGLHGTIDNLQQHGLHPGGTAMRAPANPQSYLRGKGAAGPMLTQAVLDKVDPKHQLTEGQRKFAALSAIWQYHNGKGEPEKAKRAAGAMLQQYRIDAGHYAALARAAMENGKVDDAVHLANKSYANVPDGRDLKIENRNGTLIATATDPESGKTVSKKVLTPQEFYGALAKIQPHDFDKTLVEAAGQRYSGGKQKAAGPKALTLKDRETARTAIPSTENDEAGNIAAHIYGANDGVSPKDALDVANHLIAAKPGVSMKSLDDGGAEIELHDGRSVKVSKNIRMQIDALRGKSEYDRQVETGKKVKDADEKKASNEAIDTALEKGRQAQVEKRGGGQPGSRAAVQQYRAALDEQQPKEEPEKTAAMPEK